MDSSLELAAATHFAPVFARLLSDDPAAPFGMPGAVLAVGAGEQPAVVLARGVDAAGCATASDSLFALASASKLATGLVVLRLVDDGCFALDTPLAELLPAARAAANRALTVRHLMSHTSGLPLEVPSTTVQYDENLRWPAIAEACLATEPATPPGAHVQYSNVAFGLLGLAVERATNESLDVLLERLVFAPLGIEAYFGAAAGTPPRQPIAVRDVPTPHTGTALEPYNSALWRSLSMPWAGVVTTAAGLLALVRAYAGHGALLSSATARAARTDQTRGASGGFGTTDPFIGHSPSRQMVWDPCPWGLAVEVQGGKKPHWAPSGLPRSFGQVGSSGCLAWCDPDADTAWVVLGTRATEGGWLLRFGTTVANAARAAAAEAAAADAAAADAAGANAAAT